MGKTFVEDERPCDSCVNVTRYGCASWNCEYINRDEAIKAWREKHETADRKTENSSEKPNNSTCSKMEQVDKDINVRSKDCETCKWGEWYRQGYDITMMDDECGGCCSWNSKWTPKDKPHTEVCDDCIWHVCNYNKAFAEPQTCSVNGRPYDCGNCEYHKCTADEPQTHDLHTNTHECVNDKEQTEREGE